MGSSRPVLRLRSWCCLLHSAASSHRVPANGSTPSVVAVWRQMTRQLQHVPAVRAAASPSLSPSLSPSHTSVAPGFFRPARYQLSSHTGALPLLHLPHFHFSPPSFVLCSRFSSAVSPAFHPVPYTLKFCRRNRVYRGGERRRISTIHGLACSGGLRDARWRWPLYWRGGKRFSTPTTPSLHL